MSTAPSWLNAILRQFGEGIGLKEFGLNDRGAAVLRFETGVALRFEYAFESLVVALQVPSSPEPATLKHFLAFAQPERRPGFKLRVAYLDRENSVLLAARLAEREVTLPVLNTVFGELWQLANP
ncbi:MAG: hypothetical protein J6Y80_07665 [Victivallales bacterium]|nr:hypothetical protein [Victivallales bacterium]